MPNYQDIVNLLEALISKRDPYNHHGPRVSIMATRFAKILNMSEHEIEMMNIAGSLHDVGKLLVREDVLNIPRKLTVSEKASIKIHAAEGYKLLASLDYDPIILDVALHHHENWDGKGGYPDRLKGDEISVYARILRIVDVYDALTSKRAYRSALAESDTIDEMKRLSGKWFDPIMLNIFFNQVIGDGTSS